MIRQPNQKQVTCNAGSKKRWGARALFRWQRPVATRITAIFALIFLLGSSQLKAQWAIYGSGADGNLNSSSGTTYTDNVRYNAFSLYNSSSGGGPYVNTLTINLNTGYGSFSTGDRILVIDMMPSGCNTRNYELATVTAISFSTLSAVSAVTNANTVHISNGTKSYLQVLRIPQWFDVTLTGSAVLSCHAWEPSSKTGGILAFNASNTLDLSGGGTINTENAGATGVTATAGGVAGTVSLAIAQAGNASKVDGQSTGASILGNVSNGNAGIGLGISCLGTPSNIFGGDGGCGDHAMDGAGPYQGNISYNFCPSNYGHLFFNIGNAGYSGVSGQGAGAGGNGGGGGAGLKFRGLLPADAHDGAPGTNPTGAPNGGTGGTGGNGGGSVYIKANDIVGPGGTTKVIISHGTAGTIGDTKSYTLDRGGFGGNGGKGGDAGCGTTSLYAPGGGGGYGEGGNGPDGGGGGDGGNGGAIWIEYYTASGFGTSNMDATGGAGGTGGYGGMAGVNGTQGANGGTNGMSCNSAACNGCSITTWNEKYPFGSPKACNYDNCDCDNAFRVLSYMQTHTVVGGVVTYGAPNTGSARSFCVKKSTGL